MIMCKTKRMGKLRKYIFIFVLWSLVKPLMGTDEPNLFSIPDGMELRTQFWINVFTIYSNHQMIIHDTDKPERIYKIVDFSEYFPNGIGSQKEKAHILKTEKERIISILNKCANINDDGKSLSQEELRIYRLFGTKPTKTIFIRAAQSVRVQEGMKETFLEGLVRSGMYLSEIKTICRRYGLPEELAYLPHIESSFYPYAQSKYGAVGMWQFTRDTGKMYLTIRSEIDERRDPFLSAEAAVKHLKMLFKQLGSWPLSITAYNYGLTGMKRAVQKVRTTDLLEIIQKYNNRRFGFASKNFYAEFIAAVWVSEKASQYFGQISYDLPLKFTTYQLPDHYKLSTIVEMFDIPINEFKELNPALRPPIFQEEKSIPKGYSLRLPVNSDEYIIADSTTTESQQSLQEIQNENVDQKTEMWTSLFKSLKSWVVTSFALKYDQMNQKANNHLIPSVKESENPINSDRQILNNSDEDSLNLITQNATVNTDHEPLTPHIDIKPSLTVYDNTVIVQPDETLGHFADWLEISTWTLRRLNNLSYYQQVRVGQKIDLEFNRVPLETFQERRTAYHQKIQNEFFKQYKINGSIEHTIGRGETLWTIATYQFDIPLWLLIAYNHDEDPNRIRPGETVMIPIVEKVDSSQSGTT